MCLNQIMENTEAVLAAKILLFAPNPLFPNRKTNLKRGNTSERIPQQEPAGIDVTQRMGFIGWSEQNSCFVHIFFNF